MKPPKVISTLFICSILFIMGWILSAQITRNPESRIYGCVMVDSQNGSRRTSGKMSEFYWSVFGSERVIMRTGAAYKGRPLNGSRADFDFEFMVAYYPASCEHTLFLQEPLGSELIRLRVSDKQLLIIQDDFPAFDTNYNVAYALIRKMEAGADLRW